MKKIVFRDKPGFLSLTENRRGVFVSFEEGDFKNKRNQIIKYKHIKIIDVYKTKATIETKSKLFSRRRPISSVDVEKCGMKVENYVNINPEIIPDVIQALKLAYKEATGVTDVEVEQELSALKEEDHVGEMIKKAGGVIS